MKDDKEKGNSSTNSGGTKTKNKKKIIIFKEIKKND